MAYTPSRSYFWSCLSLDEECPLFNTSDPLLYYFGLSLLGIYLMFIVVVMTDLNFWWALDNGECDIGHYANVVKQKVSDVQAKQFKLMSTPTLAEKLLTKSREAEEVVRALRATLSRNDDCQYFQQIIATTSPGSVYSEVVASSKKKNSTVNAAPAPVNASAPETVVH